MTSFRGTALAGVTMVGLLTGCLFRRGGSDLPPPIQTAATTRLLADSLWSAANDHFRNGRWNKALETLDRTMLLLDIRDPRRAKGYFMIGESRFAKGENLQAVREFRRVSDEVGAEELAPEALLRAGDAYADLWRRPELDPSYGETALLTYQEVLQRYPGTSAALRAQQRILDLRERFAEKELRNAMFYYKFKAYDSAILTFRSLIATYPRTRAVPEALKRLIESYRKTEYLEDLRETCEYAQRFFPQVLPEVERDCAAGGGIGGTF